MSTFEIEVLVTVKAYPQPSRTYGESVCIAGVRLDGPGPTWCRLYPVDFRGLPAGRRFRKYDRIRCLARSPRNDRRPESLCPILDTIEVVGHVDDWMSRREYVEPLLAGSMCELLQRQRRDRTSLGLFRPAEITRFTITPANEERWSGRKLTILNQENLLVSRGKRPLEKIPYEFRFGYRCGPRCRGHHQQIIDWEVAENFRKTAGRPIDERLRLLSERWLGLVCRGDRDTHFFVGNQKARPAGFMVLGAFWPPRVREPDLALF